MLRLIITSTRQDFPIVVSVGLSELVRTVILIEQIFDRGRDSEDYKTIQFDAWQDDELLYTFKEGYDSKFRQLEHSTGEWTDLKDIRETLRCPLDVTV